MSQLFALNAQKNNYMLLKVFSIYDSKTKSYAPPFTANHVQTAFRLIKNLVRQDSVLSREQKDFFLCEIATFDDSTAAVTALTASVNHGSIDSITSADDLGVAESSYMSN